MKRFHVNLTVGSIPEGVRVSRAPDLSKVRDLLAAARLPIEDLNTAPGLRFWVAEDQDRIVGAVGLESLGAAGLLRSLVVAPSHRQHGLGSSLTATLEREARANGIEVLVLLTETAEPFFKRHGYQVIERKYVPDEIKQSAEFQSLCPALAICMTKSLQSLGVVGSHE
jgi:amino-acid N-acetyltransferase